jgi:tetratricopeptide (TPR) repeat protein
MMNLGVTYHREGNLAKATEYYERSLAQQQAHGEYKDWPALRERALALSNLSVLHIEYGPDPDRGSQLAQEALAIHQVMGDKSWEAQDHNSLGLYDMNSGRYGQAIQHFQQARRLARSVGENVQELGSVGENVQELGFSTYNLGRCYFFHNQYEQGLESVRNALSVFEGLEDPFDVALSQILLGWIYHRLGDTDQARPLLEEGLQAAIDKGYGELLPDAYAALGELYVETGERERAKQSWQRGSALWKEPAVSESTVEARSNLGIMVAEEGNLDRGLSYSRASAARARQLQHRHTLARTLINLAGVHLLRKEYSEAKEVLEELTSLDEQELGLELRALAFHRQGMALDRLGKTVEAEASYRQGQEAIRKLQLGLDPGHRESFAARREVKVLIP